MVGLINVVCGVYARNDCDQITGIFQSLYAQSKPFNAIVFLDDGSIDATQTILSEAIRDPPVYTEVLRSRPHENYLTTGKLHITVNKLFERLYEYDPDYFLIVGADTRLSPAYNHLLTTRAQLDPRLVICSGWIRGETYRRDVPRGAGRLYRTTFMNRYCRPLPPNSLWESYPLYKALSLGLHILAFQTPRMTTTRPTKDYKGYYGYAMRQLGYFPLYAWLRLLKGFLTTRETIHTLRAYRRPLPIYDESVRRWLVRYQLRRLITFHLK